MENEAGRIAAGSAEDQLWAAGLMASLDPWKRLGRGLDQCRRRCADPAMELFVLRQSDRNLGFVLLDPQGLAGAPYIASIAVDPAFQGQGIGARLVQFAETRYAGRARFMFLCVSSFNVRARRLYERLGYECVSELTDHVIDGASEFLMRKRLETP